MNNNPQALVADVILLLFVLSRLFIFGTSNWRAKLIGMLVMTVVLYVGREVSAYYITPETPMVWSFVSMVVTRVIAGFVFLKVMEYDD
jgi:hypothetical protein